MALKLGWVVVVHLHSFYFFFDLSDKSKVRESIDNMC